MSLCRASERNTHYEKDQDLSRRIEHFWRLAILDANDVKQKHNQFYDLQSGGSNTTETQSQIQ